MNYPEHLLKLISLFKKLPGVGSKSAERFAFELLDWPSEKLIEMGQVIEKTRENLKNCYQCGSLIEKECLFCLNPLREKDLLCVVASAKDIFAIEQTHAFKGLYHVIGGLLSPLQGLNLPTQKVEKLILRIHELKVKEIILALDSTLEGDATALFLKRELEPQSVTLSRLALGMPMGSSLDYIDGGTLGRALKGRSSY